MTKLLYTGEQYDADLQQYYLRARYYHPASGRFGVADALDGTLTDPLSLHKYAYVQNDPVNKVDPSGNETLLSVNFAMSIGTTLESLYNATIAKVGDMLKTESEEANEAVDHMDNDPAQADIATIIIHGVDGGKLGGGVAHSFGWSKDFQKDLSLVQGRTPTLGVVGNPLNQDFYEFNWGGFSLDYEYKGETIISVGIIPVKSVHQMASVHLRIAQLTLWMKGYEKMNVISHSWGTTLGYDLLSGGGIEMNHWVTMGSPLNHDITKPVWNTGKWINAYSTRDPIVYLDMYPKGAFKYSPIYIPRFGTGLIGHPQVDVPFDSTDTSSTGLSIGVTGLNFLDH